jgi:ABC-type transporter Mla subunit MlaD
MPFVLRQVTPVRLSRRPSSTTTAADDNNGDDDARQLVTNWTLTACLRQLASLVSLAGDIFDQCQAQAQALNERTLQLRQRLDKVQSAVDALDSRTVKIRKLFLSLNVTFSIMSRHDGCWNSFDCCKGPPP